MNEHSSRGHTILTIYIEIESKTIGDKGDTVYITRHGKLNFVDLAGSEMVKKTNSVGKALTEANNINKSLMVLGNCISQLSSGKKSGENRKVHIPYRDSKLTKLLADSLSGNGITLMVSAIFSDRWRFLVRLQSYQRSLFKLEQILFYVKGQWRDLFDMNNTSGSAEISLLFQ